MKIIVQVKAGAKKEKVEKTDNVNFKVWVKAPAKEGKANNAVVAALAKYFQISKSKIRIKIGLKSKKKLIEIS